VNEVEREERGRMRKEREQEVVIKNTGRSRHAAELGWSDRGEAG